MPGSLSEQQYWDVIAYLLDENELLPADAVLGPDAETIDAGAAEMRSGGQVVSIYTAAQAGSPMQRRDEVRAVPGRGLEGDRYFNGNGALLGRAPSRVAR